MELTFQNIVNFGIFLAISVFVTRWVFAIPTIVKHIKVQTDLLKLMAEKQGVEDERIKEVIKQLED